MLAKVFSCAVIGLEGAIIQVEVDISRGLPSFTIVGLPDTAVQESRERVRAAIKNSGLAFPTTRLTVNLAPADLRKVGPAYDLPIALGILLANDQLWADVSSFLFVGELSLDGTVRHTEGTLPMVDVAEEEGFERVSVPGVDAPEQGLPSRLRNTSSDTRMNRRWTPLLPHARARAGGQVPQSLASRQVYGI
jgi:magnesium chelatase family protein